MSPVTPAEEEAEQKKELVAERRVDQEQWPQPDESIHADSAARCAAMCKLLCSGCQGKYHHHKHHCVCQRGPLFPYIPHGQHGFARGPAEDESERPGGGAGRGRAGSAEATVGRRAGKTTSAKAPPSVPVPSPSPSLHLFASVKKQLEKRHPKRAEGSDMEAVAHTVIDFLLGRDGNGRNRRAHKATATTDAHATPRGPHVTPHARQERGRSGGGRSTSASPSSARRLLSSSSESMSRSLYDLVVSESSSSEHTPSEARDSAAKVNEDVHVLEREVATLTSPAHGRHVVHAVG